MKSHNLINNPLLQAAETNTENASSWLESVLSATLKCLNQVMAQILL